MIKSPIINLPDGKVVLTDDLIKLRDMFLQEGSELNVADFRKSLLHQRLIQTGMLSVTITNSKVKMNPSVLALQLINKYLK